MKPEDIGLLVAGLVTLIINAIPSISQVVPPQYSAIILAAGALLKATLEYLQTPPSMVTRPVYPVPSGAFYQDVISPAGIGIKVQLTQMVAYLAANPTAVPTAVYYDINGTLIA